MPGQASCSVVNQYTIGLQFVLYLISLLGFFFFLGGGDMALFSYSFLRKNVQLGGREGEEDLEGLGVGEGYYQSILT